MRGGPPAALALAFALAGCETFQPNTCDTSVTGNPAVVYAGGKAQGGVYQSSPPGGELLAFPGGMLYALQHDLGAAPRWVSVWVSFEESGTADGGSVARASANEAVIRGVSDTTITVQNEGCQDYWLLVAAGTGATQPPDP